MNTVSIWHTKNSEEVVKSFSTSRDGLTQEEVEKRKQEYGPNSIPEAKPKGLFTIFLEQFKSPLIYTLIAAAVVLTILKEWIDGGIITFVLLFNAVVGTIQAGRAQNTLLALRKFVKTDATVIRGGSEQVISDTELIPGDIIILQEGEKVPADGRIIDCKNFRTDESALTGESEPVNKKPDALTEAGLPPSDQKNMVFRGTHVVAGNAVAVVVATGAHTEVGKISQKISSIDTEIPLQKKIRHFAHLVIIMVLVISISIFGIGFATGKEVGEMFKLSVAVVVSAVPEGLPIVMTLLLATGVWRMSKRNVLVKRLQAVEALGETKVIAVDKTGTVTENKMIIQKAWVAGESFKISGSGYDQKGAVSLAESSEAITVSQYPQVIRAARISALTCNAKIKKEEGKDQEWKVAGEPTQAAMLVFAGKLGVTKVDLLEKNAELAEIPFESRLKYHMVLQKGESGGNILSASGAPEVILNACTKVLTKEKEEEISEEKRKELEEIFLTMAKEGLRIIALADKTTKNPTLSGEDLSDLTFVGILGMKDGLRPGVKDAVSAAREAGARVVMITGDHKVTAEAIAKEAGIINPGDKVLSGEELDGISKQDLPKLIEGVAVFARVTPEHKLDLIEAFRHRGEVVAMTGDGVNDALSLVAADVGVAMGKIGTEVAKEASDIVLLDDDFGSIVAAIEEGRSIYKNLKKVLLFLFSTNIGEILTIIGALAIGYPLPVLAAQLIWLNFVTDGFLVAALAMEPKESGILKEKFKKPSRFIFDGYMAQRMALMATTMAVGSLWLFHRYFEEDIVKGMTVALTTMAVFQWFKAWSCRSDTRSIFTFNFLENKYLVAATITIILLQLAGLHLGFLQAILRTVPLSLSDWALIVPVAASAVLVDEIRKLIRRKAGV